MKRLITAMYNGPLMNFPQFISAYVARFAPRAEELVAMLDEEKSYAYQPGFMMGFARYLYDLTIESMAIKERKACVVSDGSRMDMGNKLPYRLMMELAGSRGLLVYTNGILCVDGYLVDLIRDIRGASWDDLVSDVVYSRKNSTQLATLYKYFDPHGWALGGWPLIDQDHRAAEARVAAGEYGSML